MSSGGFLSWLLFCPKIVRLGALRKSGNPRSSGEFDQLCAFARGSEPFLRMLCGPFEWRVSLVKVPRSQPRRHPNHVPGTTEARKVHVRPRGATRHPLCSPSPP